MTDNNLTLIDKSRSNSLYPTGSKYGNQTKLDDKEKLLSDLQEKAVVVQDYLQKVDQEGLYEYGKTGFSWFIKLCNWLYIFLEPFHFLFKALLGCALLCYGAEFHLVVIFIQTFMVTAYPILIENWKFLQNAYNNIVTILIEHQKNMREQLKDQETVKKELETVGEVKRKINDQVKNRILEKLGKKDNTDIEELQNKLDKQNWMVSGAKLSGQVFTKIMARIDPEKLQKIGLALIAGIITCLITLKNETMSLITQAVHIADQIAIFIKENTKPLMIKCLNENKENLQDQIDEDDKKYQFDKDGNFTSTSQKWINIGIDVFWAIVVVVVCWRVNWVLHVFASVQLGSSILGEEINRCLVQWGKPKLSGKTLVWSKQFFLCMGLVIQIWLLAEVPIVFQLIFSPIFGLENLLEIYVASPGI